MTFTLVTHLREQLLELVRSRMERKKQVESEKERLAIEVRVLGPVVLAFTLIPSNTGRGSTYARNASYPRKLQSMEGEI